MVGWGFLFTCTIVHLIAACALPVPACALTLDHAAVQQPRNDMKLLDFWKNKIKREYFRDVLPVRTLDPL